jgi:hypothetical protein
VLPSIQNEAAEAADEIFATTSKPKPRLLL